MNERGSGLKFSFDLNSYELAYAKAQLAKCELQCEVDVARQEEEGAVGVGREQVVIACPPITTVCLKPNASRSIQANATIKVSFTSAKRSLEVASDLNIEQLMYWAEREKKYLRRVRRSLQRRRP